MSRIARIGAAALSAGAVVLGGTGMALASTDASGAAIGSPGFISGNLVQIPIHAPINACGNPVLGAGAVSQSSGNVCLNGEDPENTTKAKSKSKAKTKTKTKARG